jgi:hypothetical protein
MPWWLGGRNPVEVEDTPMGEPESDQCDFGVSAACTEQPEFMLPNGRYVCSQCRLLLRWEDITEPVLAP